ncbi:SDR family NAD(P)-dependent oxidoreductase [Steroidobacter sp. S1-65]|uniref:SDR family NAD(P)-dependent oxidoreductase n=1 Tax=Steroidobacter gossypii TaxID=2805490 RepID=A0ABS1X6R8_9GAMM|nr:SDR family NAD(P)-dependent oxidoreductase [Steroidobacter gossypii]
MPIPIKDVQGKVAFITGGSSGIGLGIARALSDAGMKIVISYRTREHLSEAMKYLENARERVHAVELDVTNRDGIQAAAAEAIKVFGKIHVLVNNAGVYALGPFSEATRKDWDWMMNVNVGGVFNCLEVFLPHLRAHGEGSQIVTTASAWGLFAVENAAIYCASKAAVIMMMEVLRGELLPLNIGVSVYCPGAVFSRGWNSQRNRPTELGGLSHSTDTSKLAEHEASGRKLRDTGALMDPFEAGRIVLEGIRNNYLYILSHPEYEGAIRDRSEAVLASIPAHVQVPEARLAIAQPTLSNPSYTLERDRRRCLGRERSPTSKIVR